MKRHFTKTGIIFTFYSVIALENFHSIDKVYPKDLNETSFYKDRNKYKKFFLQDVPNYNKKIFSKERFHRSAIYLDLYEIF